MVKQYAVDGEHAVALAVVLSNPEAVLFRNAIRRAGIERRCLSLRHFLHESEEFGCGILIDFACLLHTKDSDSLKKTKDADSIGICGIFRHIERHLDMALGREIVNLTRVDLM